MSHWRDWLKADAWRETLPPLGLFLLALACYANTLDANFLLSWDDNRYVVENPLIRALDLESLRQIWTQPYFLHYIPVTLMSYAVDYQVWGLNPLGYHLTNILLHAVNGVLVYLLCCQLQPSRWVAGLAAAIFVVHPLQVETVAWVSERKNLLSLLFFLLAFLAHIRSRADAAPWYSQWLAWGCYALAVLAKSVVVCGPLLFMAYDYAWAAYSWRRAILRNLPSLSVALLGAGLTILSHQGTGMISYWSDSPWLTALLMLRVGWEYLFAVVVPIGLNHRYLYDLGAAIGHVQIGLGVSIVVLMGVLAWRQPLGKPLTGFAILWIVVFFLPVSNLFPFAIQRADRYMYIPSVALFLLFAMLVHRLWQWVPVPGTRRVFVSALVVLLLTLPLMTFQRNEVWTNSETLWRDHLTDYPYSAGGLLNLGVYYYQQEDYARSRPFFRQVLELRPQHLRAHLYLAQAAYKEGSYQEAIDAYGQALKIRPQRKDLYDNLGSIYYQIGQYDAAISAYKAALTIDPQFTRARFHLGNTALHLSDYALARESFAAVLQLHPKHAPAIDGLCQALTAGASDRQVHQGLQSMKTRYGKLCSKTSNNP